jgi:hypothetical protein
VGKGMTVGGQSDVSLQQLELFQFTICENDPFEELFKATKTTQGTGCCIKPSAGS